MKLLLTGGSGLIGHALRSLIADQHPTLDYCAPPHRHCNLLDRKMAIGVFLEHKPTHVIHLAGKVGGIKSNMEQQADFWRDNALINANVLEAAKVAGVERLVACLSTCIFPDRPEWAAAGGVITPEQIHQGPPHESNFAYAYSKRFLEVGCRAYNAQYGTKFQCVIPTNSYGPHDNFNIDYGHAIPALVHKMFLAKKNGEALQVWGDGTALREFIYSRDVARLLMAVVNGEFQAEPLILSPSEQTTVAEVVGMLCSMLDFSNAFLEWENTQPTGQVRKPTDNSPLKALFPNFKFTPLKQGLEETVNWFVGKYPEVRK